MIIKISESNDRQKMEEEDASDPIAQEPEPFFLEIQKIPELLEIISTNPPVHRIKDLLQIITYWVSYKFDQLVEPGFAEQIKQIFFEHFIDNYNSYDEQCQILVSKIQAALFINMQAQWAEMFPWMLSLDQIISSKFLLQLSLVAKSTFCIKSYEIKSLRELVLSSELMQSIFEYIQHLMESKLPIGFEILSLISRWCDPSFLLNESVLQIFYDNISDKKIFPSIFSIFTSIITRAETEEKRIELIGSLISEEVILEQTRQCDDESFGVCAEEYLYHCFISIDDSATQSALVQAGRNVIGVCPAAKSFYVRTLKCAVTQNPDLLQDAFGNSWEICLALANSDVVTPATYDQFVDEISEAIDTIERCLDIDKSTTMELVRSVHTELDIVGDPQTATALALLERDLSMHQRLPLDVGAAFAEQAILVVEIPTEELIGSAPHLVLLYSLVELALIRSSAFMKYAAALHNSIFAVITSDLDEETLQPFAHLYSMFFKAFSGECAVTAEALGELVMTVDPDIVHVAAQGMVQLGDPQAVADSLEVLHALLRSQDPRAGALALLSFARSVCMSQGTPEYLEACAAALEGVEDLLGDDTVLAAYIAAVPHLSPPGPEGAQEVLDRLGSLVPALAGPLSASNLALQIALLPINARPTEDDPVCEFLQSATSAVLAHVQVAGELCSAGRLDPAVLQRLVERFESCVRHFRVPAVTAPLLPRLTAWVTSAQRLFFSLPDVFVSVLRLGALVFELDKSLTAEIIPGMFDFFFAPSYDVYARHLTILHNTFADKLRSMLRIARKSSEAAVAESLERIGIGADFTPEFIAAINDQKPHAAFLQIWRMTHS